MLWQQLWPREAGTEDGNSAQIKKLNTNYALESLFHQFNSFFDRTFILFFIKSPLWYFLNSIVQFGLNVLCNLHEGKCRFKKNPQLTPRIFGCFEFDKNQICGPAATNFLPSSVSVYCSKFAMYFAARDFAFSSHSAALE